MSLKSPGQSPLEIYPNVMIGANATGLGGFATKMNDRKNVSEFTVHGVSALPVIGGVSRDVIKKLRDKQYAKFVSFEEIKTKATGSYDPALRVNKANVAVRASIKGLKLLRRFEAAKLRAVLILQHEGDGHQPIIAWTGTQFSGLILDGYKITVTLDDELSRLKTLHDLEKKFEDHDFADRYSDKFFRLPDSSARNTLPRFGKAHYCMFSIVKSISCKHPNVRIQHHVLSLKGFGAIHFGEMLVLPESRQLTLLKFKLGCKDEGEIACCDVVSRGESCPP